MAETGPPPARWIEPCAVLPGFTAAACWAAPPPPNRKSQTPLTVLMALVMVSMTGLIRLSYAHWIVVPAAFQTRKKEWVPLAAALALVMALAVSTPLAEAPQAVAPMVS